MIELKEMLAKIKPDQLSGQEAELYIGITEKNWQTDKEALQFFWPENEHGQTYLWTLKNRVLKKLVTSILKQPGESSYQSAYIECWREFAAVQILRGLNLQKGAFWMGERLLKKALKYEQTEIAVPLANFLEFDAARLLGDHNKKNEFQKIREEQELTLQEEMKAQRYFMELTSSFSSSQSIKNQLKNLSESYSIELKKGLYTNSSYRYAFYTYRILCIQTQLKGNYIELIDYCHEALAFFKAKNYSIPRSVLFGFTFKPIQASIKIRDYEAAKQYINTALNIDPQGSHNHNACLLYQAILGLHSNNSGLTKSAIQQSSKHRKYPPIKEQWRIIEAYANFLDYDIGKPFRVAKFLNEVPIFSSDKRGNNISILIIQILFYLKQNKKGKIIDRAEALKLYSQRYLRKDETFRSNCFIHMLLCLPKANFHPVAVQRHAKKYVDQLSKYQSDEVEIIPYEELWERVLELLG